MLRDITIEKLRDDDTEGFSVGKFWIYEVIYENNNPEYINFKHFSLQVGNRRFDYGEIFTSDLYKNILRNKTKENTSKNVKYYITNPSLFVHTSMLEILLHWMNRLEYLEYLFYLCFDTRIEDYKWNFSDNVFLALNKSYNIYKLFNLIPLTVEISSNFIILPKMIQTFKLLNNLKISENSSHYNDKFKNKNKKYFLNCCKLYFEEKLNIECIKYCDKKNDGVAVNPSLIFPVLDNVDTFKFRNIVENYILLNNSLKQTEIINIDYTIDLNNSITKRCENNRFAYAIHADMEVKFDTETSYIHAKTSGDLINKAKMENMNRFLKNNDTLEFIKELEENIKNIDIAVPVKMRVTEKHEENNKKMNTIEENIDNTDNIDENDYKIIDENDINENDYKIIEKNDIKKCYYKLIHVENEYKGYYFHPDLFLYFIIWLDKKIAIKYIKLLNIIFQNQSLTGKSINKYTDEMVNNLINKINFQENMLQMQMNTITQQTETIENQTKTIEELEVIKEKFIKANPSLGSIKILIVSDNEIKIQNTSYELLKTKGTLKIYTNYDHKIIYDNIKTIIKDNPTDYIQYIENNKFYISNTEKAIELIENIINGRYELCVSNKNFDEEIKKYRNPENKGKLYEYQCAKHFNVILWKNVSEVYLKTYNLNKKDVGVDLIDVKNKILYQCKNYNTRLNMSKLATFERTFKLFKSKDEEWKQILIVNDINKLSSDVINNYKNNIVEIPYDKNFNLEK